MKKENTLENIAEIYVARISNETMFQALKSEGAGLLVDRGELPFLPPAEIAESLKVSQPFRGAHYKNWERYFNNDLPRSITLSIARDLEAASEYQDFPESGRLLKTAITEPQEIDHFGVPFAPLRVRMRNLFQEIGALAAFQVHVNTKNPSMPVAITDKTTGEVSHITFTDPTKYSAELDLEQSIVLGSNAAKALLVTKEISFLLDAKNMKQLLYDEFTYKYDLQSSSTIPLADLLLTNAVLPDSQNTPGMGYYFKQASILMDWAGYWHITPALGRMLRQNVLTSDDRKVLDGNVAVFNGALKRGLIIAQKPGTYVWKEGVTPYSHEWQDLMANTPGVPELIK